MRTMLSRRNSGPALLALALLIMFACGDSPSGGEGLDVTVTQPPAGGATADTLYTIAWE